MLEFPHILDSTMIAAYKACPHKFWLEFIHHYKPLVPSVHLHAGAAYAKGLEVAREAYYIHQLHSDDAQAAGLKALIEAYGTFECPPDSAKSLERMAGAFEYYFTQYPFERDMLSPIMLSGNKRGIEFSFAEPIDLAHPSSGDPLIYCGRLDMICNYAGGIFGYDDKTTTSLGASWPKQWDLRGQFTGYGWGAQRAGRPLQGFVIRGISILKTKYETMQAITYRPQWMLDRWYESLISTVVDMQRDWEDDYWRTDESEACTSYGGCQFRQPCLSADPQPWLDTGFAKRIWNPLLRQETTL